MVVIVVREGRYMMMMDTLEQMEIRSEGKHYVFRRQRKKNISLEYVLFHN